MIHIQAMRTPRCRFGPGLSLRFIVQHVRLATLLVEWLGCGTCCAALRNAFLSAERIT